MTAMTMELTPGPAERNPHSSDMHFVYWVPPRVTKLVLHLLAQMLTSYCQRIPSVNVRQAGDL